MTTRHPLGWASLAVLVLGIVFLVLLWASGAPSGAALAVGLGGAGVAAIFAIIGGSRAWRTGPGKAALIGGILLAVGLVVLGGFAYIVWAVMRLD
jgi:hypothetical protein